MNTISPQMLGLAGEQVTLVTGPSFAGAPAPARGAGLRRLGRQAWRRRWILLGGLAAGALAGLLVTALTPRQYASTVGLQIARETSQVLTVGAITHDVSIGDQEFYQTQYGLLRAQTLAERVARDVGVVDAPAFFEMFHREAHMGGRPGSPEYARRNALAGRILLDHVRVAPVRGSSLVEVQVKTPSPELSRKIAEAWGQDFIASNLERRLDASSYARQYLQTRLDQLRERLERSERLAVEYAARYGIVDLPQGGSDGPHTDVGRARSLVTDDLGALNAARDAAVIERVQAASRLASSGGQPGADITALDNRAINLLRRDRAEAAAEEARLTSQGSSDDGALKTARARVEALDAAIAREEGRVRTSLQQTYQAAASREQALTGKVDALKGSLAELRRRSIQYNIYRRDADTNRELYDGLLQRYKEIGVAGALGSNNIAIVDAAQTPERPASPRLVVNLALFLLAGGLLGGAGAVLAEQLDDTLWDPDDVKAKLGLPGLGATPALKNQRPLEALKDPCSALAEAYLVVEANLELAARQGAPPRSLAVVSARPGDGRTTTAIALARTLARAGRKVALVDADLRGPSLHTAFGLRNDTGLGDLLSGAAELAAALKATDQEGLSVVTAGSSPANPADLLLGERLAAVISQLQHRFDHVVVDAPPVAGLADAALIAAAVECVLCVARAGVTPAGDVRAALARLGPAQIAGVVLTITRHKSTGGRSRPCASST